MIKIQTNNKMENYMTTYQESKRKMELALETYNKKWKEFILNIRDESEDRLEYLIALSDKSKRILENLSFIDAKWIAHEISTSKSYSYIGAVSESQKYVVHISKKDEQLVEFNFYIRGTEKIVAGDEEYEDLIEIDVFTKKELELVRTYLDDFGIVEMCNAGNAAWR
ncbi:hypothetical protein R3O67_29815 [Bacillus cereus]